MHFLHRLNKLPVLGIFDYRIRFNIESIFGLTRQSNGLLAANKQQRHNMMSLRCFWYYFVHFNSSHQAAVCLTAVNATDVSLKSFYH